MFTLAGLVGVAITLAAWMSRSYRQLSAAWVAAGSRPTRTSDEPPLRIGGSSVGGAGRAVLQPLTRPVLPSAAGAQTRR